MTPNPNQRRTGAATPGAGGRAAAFFDFDNTLLADDGAKIGVRYMWETGRMGLGFLLKVALAHQLFRRHILNTEQMARLVLGFYRGHPSAEFFAQAGDYYRERIQPKLAPAIMARLEEHRRQGHVLVLQTGSPCYLMRPVVAQFGFHHALCTDLEVDAAGRFTGRPGKHICLGEKKKELALDLAREAGLDLAASWFYSDHHDDLPMLEAVGHPVAVAPTRPLRRVAEARGWPILSHDAPCAPLDPSR